VNFGVKTKAAKIAKINRLQELSNVVHKVGAKKLL